METIFYLLVVSFLAFEIVCLYSMEKVHKGVLKYKGVTDPQQFSALFIAFIMFNWVYLYLCVVGLMSSQWICFAALILMSFVPKHKIWWRYTDSVLSIAILVFIILNKYHLHIKLTELLIKNFAQ